METFVLDYISKLEGIKTRIKEIHWEESTISGHELAGDVETMICDFEDSVAEDLQGVFDEDIKVKSLSPKECSANTQKELINELKSATLEFYKKLEGDDYIGARSEVEGFIHNINVKRYLVNKTTSKLNENMTKKLTEDQLVDMLAESLMPDTTQEGSNELEQEALRIWNENNLESDIEWEESEWVTSGDETYGPCGGFVECDGWEFEVPGNQDGYDTYEIDYDEPIEFTSPNGETGSFYLRGLNEEKIKLSQEDLDEVIKIAAKMVLDRKK